MMTARGRWMMLPAMGGLFLGVLRSLPELSLLSLSVLVWLAVEWAQFCWRVRYELPRLQIERTVNGRSETTGLLWAGRTLTIVLRVTLKPGRFSKSNRAGSIADSLGPDVLIRDIVHENMEVISRSPDDQRLDGNQYELRCRTTSIVMTYLVRVRAAGEVTLPGVRLRLQDAQGLFLAERFIKLPQTFRVLPAFSAAGEVQPLVKRNNSLPQHGIHRLQRSGLGSELLELREYVPGDPPKAIAWKVSARRDKLMTRQYESEVPVRLQLFVDGSLRTRLGGFGCRLLDQMTYVAASVARAAISVGDPVGAMLFDESGARRLPPLTGERGFYRLLDELADFSINPAVPPQPLTTQMVSAAMSLAGERYPELLDRRVNQVPFTLWPLLPGSRRRFRQQFLLAGVLAEFFQLSAAQQVQLVYDSPYMSEHIQRFLMEAGVAWMEPVIAVHDHRMANAARMELLSSSLVKAVSHARDNEVFVVLADLLESSLGIAHLLPAVKMALGRHHRVAFVWPSPTFRRPTASSTVPRSNSAEDLVAAAEQIRMRELATKLQRKLRRIGATVTSAGEQAAIPLVLSEMELARSGRISSGGLRR